MLPIQVREARPDDLAQLYQLILDSTNNCTKLTREQLSLDLFEPLSPIRTRAIIGTHPALDIDETRVASNKPPLRVAVAESYHSRTLLGYVAFGYYYSPWTSRCANVLDIYVRPDARGKGIAKRLISHLSKFCEEECLVGLVFNTSGLSSSIKELIKRYNAKTYRNSESDWDVFRIEFKDMFTLSQCKKGLDANNND